MNAGVAEAAWEFPQMIGNSGSADPPAATRREPRLAQDANDLRFGLIYDFPQYGSPRSARSRGGATTWVNCVIAGKKSNTRKGNKPPKEAGLKLRTSRGA